MAMNFYAENAGGGMFWDPTGDTNEGSLTLGTTGGSAGVDLVVYGATSGAYMKWDQGGDDLLLVLSSLISSGVTGYATTATFLADTSRTHYAISIGNRAGELTVNLGNAATQNLELFQMNVNFTCTSTGPTNASSVTLMRIRSTHDTTDMQYLRLRNINTYMDVQQDLQDAYGAMYGVDFTTNSLTVHGEAAVLALNMECASAVTGEVRGLIINVYGANLATPDSIALEVRTDGGASTLDVGVKIWAVGSNRMTTGLYILSEMTDSISIANPAKTTSGRTGIKVVNSFTKTTSGVHKGISVQVTYTPATSGAATPIGIVGKVIVDAEMGICWAWGIQGQIDFSDNANLTNGTYAAVRAVMTASATPDFTNGNICGLYIDNLIVYDLTGMTSSLIHMGNHGGSYMDNAMYIHGRDVTYLFELNDCEIGGFQSDAGGVSHGGTLKTLKLNIDSVDYYFIVSTTPQ